jgi:hypothetical protein
MSDNAISLVDDLPPDSDGEEYRWELKKLKPNHKQLAALLAQGYKNVEAAAIVGVTPQYITMLMGQKLFFQECQRLASVAGVRLEALTEQSVEVIADTMKNGSEKGKLAAARLQLEATKRIGRPDPMRGGAEVDPDRLLTLSTRLVELLQTQRGVVHEGTFTKEETRVRHQPISGFAQAAKEIGGSQSSQGD